MFSDETTVKNCGARNWLVVVTQRRSQGIEPKNQHFQKRSGAVGFADDYLKIVRRSHHGLWPRYKMLYQVLIASIVGVTPKTAVALGALKIANHEVHLVRRSQGFSYFLGDLRANPCRQRRPFHQHGHALDRKLYVGDIEA